MKLTNFYFKSFFNFNFLNLFFLSNICFFGFEFLLIPTLNINYSKKFFSGYFLNKFLNLSKLKLFIYKAYFFDNSFYYFISYFNYNFDFKKNFLIIIFKKFYFSKSIKKLSFIFYKNNFIIFSKKIIKFLNNFNLFFYFNIFYIKYFYSKLDILNFYSFYKEIFIIFNWYFYNFCRNIFNLNNKIFFLFLRKIFFKRIIFFFFLNLELSSIIFPNYILYLLKLNNFSNVNFKNIILYYFYLNFGIFFNIFNFLDNQNILLTDYFYNFNFIKVFNKSILIENKIFGFFNKFCLVNLFGIFNNFNSTSIVTKNFFFQISVNNFFFHNYNNIFNFFFLNNYLDYIVRILSKIFCNKYYFLIDKIIDLPLNNIIILNIFNILNFLGFFLNIIIISNILNFLNYNFLYFNFFYFISLSKRNDILIDLDLLSEINKFFNLKKRKFFFLKLIKNFELKKISFFFKLRSILFYKDYFEILSYSFIDYKNNFLFSYDLFPIIILNPISKSLNTMRSNLILGLIKNFLYNFKYFYLKFNIYEIGKIYFYDPTVKNGNFSTRGYSEFYKFSILYNINNLEKIFLLNFYNFFENINSIFFPIALNYNFSNIIFNPTLNFFQLFILFDKRIIGWVGFLNFKLIKLYKIFDNIILFDINLRVIFNFSKILILKKKRFFSKDVTFHFYKYFDFQIIFYLIKKFFVKKNIFKLQNIFYLNEYCILEKKNKKKKISLRLIFEISKNKFKSIDLFIISLVSYLNCLIF